MFAFNNYRSFFVKRAVPMTLKRKLFHSSVTSAFLYASATWSATKKQYESVAVAQRRLERAMLGITLLDRRTNTRVRLVTKLRDVQEQCISRKWLWCKRTADMEDWRWAKLVTEWVPLSRTRGGGRPRTRWRDSLRKEAGPAFLRLARQNTKKNWLRKSL